MSPLTLLKWPVAALAVLGALVVLGVLWERLWDSRVALSRRE